ncbi:MAG: nuclease-related domain-containing protein [Candidatus Doudnabacteria bacterium]|nr:nuclease-related domain-containing protein [Candidatus Doudnabacteria bacterium]
MAKFYGRNSRYLIWGDLKNYIYAVGLVLSVLVIVWAFLKSSWVLAAPFAALIGIFILVRLADPLLMHFRRKSDKYYRGFAGEVAIKQVLKELSDDYIVFQDLKFPGLRGNIDFVVMGPTGIFTLEVKSHYGEIGFNGRDLTLNGRLFPEQNILKQGYAEALRLKNYIRDSAGREVYIIPVIVFSRGYGLRFGLNPVDGVYVVGKDFLLELIGRHPNYKYPLSQEQLIADLKMLVA